MTNETSSTDVDTDELSPAEQRRIVRDRYGEIATSSSSCCGDTGASSCCSDSNSDRAAYDDQSRLLGYADEELDAVESGANLGLGCGNPTAIASLEDGATVLDLGSGAGFDCFLAAREVGSDGHVIGVDMTPEMVETARENITKNDATNVEFRLGEIEHLPVADESVDVILSNCVVNLSPDKSQVFSEAFRVLRPGGRLAISDVVQTTQFPEAVQQDPASVAGCVAGASPISELESMLDEVGFTAISIDPQEESEAFIRDWDDERDVSDYIVSATIEGKKPNH
ncbi:arsenite methyltransferase [Haloterrigena sp. H1]|uniref:arsenite methyltransferase n=1 Tax=Haloterrigena sp. H1 TaxID=2552943 RepID=UPI00110EAADA|nr:arsenite methyltransferase [Haloterrigena sp. H1]TMT87242.1 arsenite methyltransferase [Haloterrigena sp. H1]